MRKRLESNAAARRRAARPVFEVRVGDRFVRWVGAERARRWSQDRKLATLVIPARGSSAPVSLARCGEVGAAAEASAGYAPRCDMVGHSGSGRSSSRGHPDSPVPPCGVFGDDWIVLARVGGPRLPITSVAGLARQLRRALMSFAEQPVDEIISGHRPDGAAAETPHLAVVPLPAVTGPCPDGALLGIALVLPRAVDAVGRAAVMRAIARFEEHHCPGGAEPAPAIPILLGDAGVLVLQRAAAGAELPGALRPATWSGPARRWASATPIALDRNPGDLHHADPARRRDALEAAAACVIEAVRRIGLPAPAEVEVLRSCTLPGTAEPRRYPRFPVAQRRPQRVLVHARLGFGEPVRGPVLVGAGRYHGLGLLLPDDADDD